MSQGCQEVADWYLVCGLASYSCRESLNWLFVQRVQVLISWMFPQQTMQKPDGARDEEIRLALPTYLWLSILLPLTKYFSCVALQVQCYLSALLYDHFVKSKRTGAMGPLHLRLRATYENLVSHEMFIHKFCASWCFTKSYKGNAHNLERRKQKINQIGITT